MTTPIPKSHQPPAKESVLGYPLIESLLETEKFEALNKSFAEAYQKLETMMLDREAGLKKQKDARKAMRAYELTTDLIKELLKIKYQILKAKENSKK